MLKQLFCNHQYIEKGGKIGRDESTAYYKCINCGKEIEFIENLALSKNNKDNVEKIENNLKEIKKILMDSGYTEEEISKIINICVAAIDIYDLDKTIK